MYAVFRTAGQQFRVANGDVITLNAHVGAPGETVSFGDVLMLKGEAEAVNIGAPLLAKAKVFAEVVKQGRGDKVLIFKKRRRKHYRRTRGHRQDQTVLKIVGFSLDGVKPPVVEAPAKASKAPRAPKAGAAKAPKAEGAEKAEARAKGRARAKAKTKPKSKE